MQILIFLGMNEDVLYAGFQSRFLDYIEDFKKRLDFTALDAARTLKQVTVLLIKGIIHMRHFGTQYCDQKIFLSHGFQ